MPSSIHTHSICVYRVVYANRQSNHRKSTRRKYHLQRPPTRHKKTRAHVVRHAQYVHIYWHLYVGTRFVPAQFFGADQHTTAQTPPDRQAQPERLRRGELHAADYESTKTMPSPTTSLLPSVSCQCTPRDTCERHAGALNRKEVYAQKFKSLMCTRQSRATTVRRVNGRASKEIMYVLAHLVVYYQTKLHSRSLSVSLSLFTSLHVHACDTINIYINSF